MPRFPVPAPALTRPAARVIGFVGSLLLITLLWATPCLAGPFTESGLCEPPISICNPVVSSERGGVGPDGWAGGCPPGSACTCVPSCPECDDCATFVCVPTEEPDCRTACDCPAGLGCIDGRCIAGFAPVYCCDSDVCPAGEMCQAESGREGSCPGACVSQVWSCDGALDTCGPDRVCSCTASCPLCQDCGPPVCVPRGVATPYSCGPEGQCGAGDQCVCVASCPTCSDCRQTVCVPRRCDDPKCQERVEAVERRISRLIRRTSECGSDDQCVRVATGTECRGTCGAYVNVHHVGRVRAAIDRLDERICSDFIEDGCPFATPACIYEFPACVEGRCTGLPVPIAVGEEREFQPGSALRDLP